MSEDAPADGPAASTSQGMATQAQEALFAEAAKLLKGVALKPLCAEEVEVSHIDQSWLRSAVASASDPKFALVDSGATNALRPAKEGELGGSRVIRVDLASGATSFHVNRCGTLLSQLACQVIIPAGYLVQLGYSII